MNKDKILAYLVKDGYNKELLLELNSKELYRIFILALAFNTNIAF